MTKFQDLLNGKIPEYSGAIIIPIDDLKITVIESCFDGTVETDWMHVSTPYMLHNKTVEEWACPYTGLDRWKVAEPYPLIGEHCHYEYRLIRI